MSEPTPHSLPIASSPADLEGGRRRRRSHKARKSHKAKKSHKKSHKKSRKAKKSRKSRKGGFFHRR